MKNKTIRCPRGFLESACGPAIVTAILLPSACFAANMVDLGFLGSNTANQSAALGVSADGTVVVGNGYDGPNTGSGRYSDLADTKIDTFGLIW
jgi:uncharacterized membrane protein